jgi:Domain of unknown function (DUF1772)
VIDAIRGVATIAAGIFAGAALYINVAEHPARLECGTQLAATEFGPSYHRAAVMQASLAVVGSVAALQAWLLGAGATWLYGGLLLFFVVPFTLIAIMGTNKRLLDPALDRTSGEARHLLVRWGWLHAVRTLAGTASFITFVMAR